MKSVRFSSTGRRREMIKLFQLPEVKKGKNIEFDHFPTKIQAVIFRCWEMVPASRIAKVLKTTSDNIEKLAFEMGLNKQKYLDDWYNKGYITIIKAVWHLLPYKQLLELLGWTEQRLAYILKEDDFLGFKLGDFKPDCDEIIYRELTENEKNETKRIKNTLQTCGIDFEKDIAKPFDFFYSKYKKTKQRTVYEAELSDDWCIEDYTDNNDVIIYTEIFKSELKKAFNISLSERSDKAIKLYLCHELEGNGEYHEIDIKKESIEIRAVEPVGIMRALYYLLELTEALDKCSFKIKSYKRKPVFKTRYIYSFCGLYSDVLDESDEISFPEELLMEYAKQGVNGIWIQAVLYKITPMPFDESLSDGWEKRLENLKKLAKRAARYGIKFYLYINEPRAMPIKLFEKHPEIKGQEYDDNTASLCTLTDKVQQYLKSSIQCILKNVPELGGFFAITVSENHTNCCSHAAWGDVNCPRCSVQKPAYVVAKTIDVMANAAFEINPEVKFFAWDWAWGRMFDEDDIKYIFDNIPKNAIIQCVSEYEMEYEKGGVKASVEDYALSMAGPSERTKRIWHLAKSAGHETSAKVQINNSWECSTAPFLPIYNTILTHMENLEKENVEHIMLSWTLGGYPSDNIRIASSFFFKDEGVSNDEAYNKILNNYYGEYADTVKNAANHFSKAFLEYPFHIISVYLGPQNLGTANLLFEKPTGFEATMTCFAYDDLNRWKTIYPTDVYLNQFEKICKEWQNGLEIISNMPQCEFTDMAQYGYSIFKSTSNQIKFCMQRGRPENNSELLKIIQDEKNLAIQNYKIMQKNYTVGYEAANHYYVSRTMLMEKIVQCDYLLK